MKELITIYYRSLIPCEEYGCGGTPTNDFVATKTRRVHLCEKHASVPEDKLQIMNHLRRGRLHSAGVPDDTPPTTGHKKTSGTR